MIKLTIQFLIIFLLTNCSINSKSKFWKESERKKIETSSEIELFKEKKSFSEEYNTNIKISLNNNYQQNSFVNNNKNNIKILNYDGKLNLEETFKFKKIDNFNLFQPDIHITKYSNLIIFDGRGSIIKLDENLKLIWKKNIYKKKEIKNNLLLNFSSSNNSLIVTDNISNIYSIDLKTGNLNWKKNSKSSFNSDIKIKEDRIYVVDYDNILHCLSIKNGNIIWKYISDNTLIKSTKKVSLILDDKKVVFINSLGDVNALDLVNGNLIWQTPTQKSSVVEDSFSIKYSKIVLDNKSIFFSNNKNQFFSLNSKNGNLNSEDELIRQTDRMLNDPKAHRFFERFIVQWLRTEGLGDTYNPDSDRFPEITKNKLNAMKKEGVYVFEDVIKNNKSLKFDSLY